MQTNCTSEHCWHDTGIAYTSNPPKIEKICCNCGAYAYVTKGEVVDIHAHGKHFPIYQSQINIVGNLDVGKFGAILGGATDAPAR